MKPGILVVEDDPKIAALVAKNLEAAGFTAHAARDRDSALATFERVAPVLIILDVMLPGASGIEVARILRRTSEVPILMLTARSTESDKVLGFEVGADDYLTKPFGTLELVARVRALLRRSPFGRADGVLLHGALRVDPGKRKVELEGRAVDLTTLEFDLLYCLASSPGRVFTRERLMDQVWGLDRVVDDRSIDSLVSRLRRKLEADPTRPRYVETVWGAGYRFTED
jgi:DNA-binding response OmpR family regulator